MSDGPRASREQVEAMIRSPALSVHFQPIVDLHDGMIVAYEALTRIDGPSPFLHTGELFESAEHHGLLWDLEAITRRNSLEAAANWPSHTRLFLNCTPAVFADPRFAAQLNDDLRQATGLRPERIVLEITELSDDQHIPGLTEQVRAATAAGFNVALDDAGAGASGLNRMMTLRPHWVKLDREFVRGIDSDLLRQNLVRFFVHFARLSGVSVVAEGIERATELQTVTSLGVRFAQGFYLGRPGTRAQTMDPKFISEVRTRWASVEAAVPQEMLEPTLGAICRSMPALALEATVDAALAIAPRAGEPTGVVLLHEGRAVAWAPRQCLEKCERSEPLERLLGRFATVANLPASLSTNEAITALCAREEDRLPDAIAVNSGSEVLGIVRLRDLIRMAATEGQLLASGRARLTGMPGRARADQHMAELIRKCSAGAPSADIHTDAAFVDIRAFAEFAGRAGSTRGDRLVRELAELISAVVLSSVQDAFVAHLGDDRFLVTAPTGRLDAALRNLAQAFDGQRAEDDLPPPAPTLRVLFLPGTLLTARHPRDVYRVEQRLREQARERDVQHAPHGSYVLVAPPAAAPLGTIREAA